MAAMESATANPRPTRWSDGPPPPSSADPHPSDKRPPSSLPPEPAFKKPRPDDPLPSLEPPPSSFPPNPPTLLDASSFNARSTSVFPSSFPPNDPSAFASFSQSSSFPASFAPGSAKGSGTGALFYKTKLCTKFKLGSCTFNERCHFAHGVEDLRKPPPGWEELVKAGAAAGAGKIAEPARRSNKPCRYFMEGNCPYGERCTFSHGNEDPQRSEVPVVADGSSSSSSVTTAAPAVGGSSVGSSGAATANYNAATRPNYKTRICATWEKGEICSYGDRCHFAHGQADLRPYGGVPNYNVNTMAMPAVYSEPGPMNQADPYGSVQVNYANTGVPPLSTMNANAYPGMGGVANSYAPVQGNTNGYSTTTYGYWNPDGVTSAAPIISNQSYAQPNMVPPPSQNHVSPNAAVPNQGYVQPMPGAVVPPPSYAPQLNPPPPVNQNYMPATAAAPWMANYPSDGGYAKNETTTVAHYAPDLSQQQSIQYYGGPPSYQGVNQNPPYAPPDGSQTNYQTGNKNGDVGAYYNATATYTAQQTGYIGSYNAA